MVRDFATIAEEEAKMDYMVEQPINQDKKTSEALEWQDTFSLRNDSDDGEVSGNELVGSQA